MRLTLALSTFVLYCLSTLAHADEPPASKPPPSPVEMQKAMASAMDSMVPMMGRMSEIMIQAQLKIAAQPETAQSIATFKRNLYEALIKKGFPPDQTFQLTLSTPLPSAGGMGSK